MKTVLHVDLETYSDEDLTKTGVYRYARSPAFRVMLFGHASRKGDEQVVDLEHGKPLAKEIREALIDPEVEKWAHNANFERVCLQEYLGVAMPPSQWRCTQAWCLSRGLPPSLADASKALGLAEMKDARGKRLITKFCTPQGRATLAWSAKDKKDWEDFKAYCEQDVRTEMAIHEALSRWPLSEAEWGLWEIDQAINDRGLPIDMEFVDRAVSIRDEHYSRLSSRLTSYPDLNNPNSLPQLHAWLQKRGVIVPNLQAATVDELLTRDDLPNDAREVLWCRSQLSNTSLAKFDVLQRSVVDGRLRGTYQFSGAFRTGRWSGRGFQPHNLPRGILSAEELHGE